MNLPKIRKGSPLLLLVAATILVGAVGAVLYTMYISNLFEEPLVFRGAKCLAIQAGTWDNYLNKIEATSLGDHSTHTNTVIMVILEYDLPAGEALIITPAAYEEDGATPYNGWLPIQDTMARFAIIKIDGTVSEGSWLSVSGGGYIVPNADIPKMVWNAAPGDQTNAIIIDFIFDGDGYRPDYSTMSSMMKFDITVDVEDSPP